MKALLAALAAASLFACTTTRPDTATIDADARSLMQREHVEGLALAIVDHGQVVHVAAFGRRDVARDLPLTTDTILYGASLVKAHFAFVVLQLVDEGRLDLDAPIATLLPQPLPAYERWKDLAADDRWRRLTPRMLLTHTSGFANFRWLEPDKRLRFHFDPGTRYAYSGEGLQLLQFVLAEGLGIDLGRAMQSRVFDRFGMTRTSMTWRADFADDLSVGYDADGVVQPHARRQRADAAGSMDTTIADQAKFWAALVRGDGLGASSRAELIRAQVPIVSAHQFPTLSRDDSADNARVGLAAGLGVITFRNGDGPGWYKGGHDDGTANLAVCIEHRQRCVVLLANDVRAERIYPELVRRVLGETTMRWAWEYAWLDTRP